MKNYLNTRVNKLLGSKYPIIQGGMAWVADSNLAAAVSNAGGLGIIGTGNLSAEQVRKEIFLTRKKTKNTFGVNIMLLSPYADNIAQLVIEENIKIVTTGAGTPQKYMRMWKENNIIVLAVIASVSQAKLAERAGVDGVIVEGTEAGGHIGQQTTMVLVPQVVDAVDIPVIAAGGIGDERGYMAAMMLGAEGVQMGTIFLVADETNIHENYKEKIIVARDTDTVVTGVKTGKPVRSIRNMMTKQYLVMEQENRSFEELEALTLGSLKKAVQDGDMDNGTIMAGQISGLIKKKSTCIEIIENIVKGVKEIC